jgi:hypothetical protein
MELWSMIDKTEKAVETLKGHKYCAIAVIVAFVLGAIIF